MQVSGEVRSDEDAVEGGRTERLQAITRGMRLPLIAAPMFLVSGPDLVLAACRAGIAGAVPDAQCPLHRDTREAGSGSVVEGHAAGLRGRTR